MTIDDLSFLESSRWYKITDVAALLGANALHVEGVLGPDKCNGGQVLAKIQTGGLSLAEMTTEAIAAFQAIYP